MATRNRAEERAAAGLVMQAFEMTLADAAIIDRAVAYLSAKEGRKASKVRALAWLLHEGAKKLPKDV